MTGERARAATIWFHLGGDRRTRPIQGRVVNRTDHQLQVEVDGFKGVTNVLHAWVVDRTTRSDHE